MRSQFFREGFDGVDQPRESGRDVGEVGNPTTDEKDFTARILFASHKSNQCLGIFKCMFG